MAPGTIAAAAVGGAGGVDDKEDSKNKRLLVTHTRTHVSVEVPLLIVQWLLVLRVVLLLVFLNKIGFTVLDIHL